MNIENIQNATTAEEHQTALAQTVAAAAVLTDFERNELIRNLKAFNQGGKGRSVRPEFYNKNKPVSEGNGKRGRPSLTPEEKLARIEAKLEAEKAALLEEVQNETAAV